MSLNDLPNGEESVEFHCQSVSFAFPPPLNYFRFNLSTAFSTALLPELDLIRAQACFLVTKLLANGRQK